MARKLLGGAAGVISLAADVARHVVWYVGHQVSPNPRRSEEEAES